MGWRGLVVAVVLAVLGAATLLAPSPGPAGGPLTDDELRRAADAARAATVLVSSQACGQLVRGSAFAVAGLLVTNRHLVAGVEAVDVAGHALVTSASVLETHATLDVAVVSPVGSPQLELAGDRPDPGAPVVLAGRPGGGRVVVAESQVHLYSDGRPWGMAGDVLLLDTPTGAGWSGGPVLDRHSRVVAVLAAHDRATGLALAVPVTELGPWIGAGRPATTSPVEPCTSTAG